MWLPHIDTMIHTVRIFYCYLSCSIDFNLSWFSWGLCLPQTIMWTKQTLCGLLFHVLNANFAMSELVLNAYWLNAIKLFFSHWTWKRWKCDRQVQYQTTWGIVEKEEHLTFMIAWACKTSSAMLRWFDIDYVLKVVTEFFRLITSFLVAMKLTVNRSRLVLYEKWLGVMNDLLEM